MTTDSHDAPGWQDCLRRAQMLIERDRYQDAVEWCERGLQANPDNADLHALLSLCWMSLDGREDAAVDAARRSVGLEPETSYNHAMLSLALSHRAKEGQDGMLREALESARKALELDAWSVMAYSSQTQVLTRLQRWREAEESARQALQIDPENPQLGAQLAVILHKLGKHEDHEHLAASHLAQNPEDSSAHCNAGLNALRKGDHKTANKHFLEALRLNPSSEMARVGLAESYRSRSWFYRSLVQFDSFIKKLTGGRESAFFIGGFVAYQLLYKMLEKSFPLLAYLLVLAWLLLVFWTSLARGLSAFFMLYDPFARQSLRPRDRWEGAIVGVMVFLALACLVGGLLIHKDFALAALGLFLGATPVVSAMTNDHHLGRWLYLAVMVFCLVCPLYYTLHVFLRNGWETTLPGAFTVWSTGAMTAVIFSWVRAFSILYR